MKVLAEIEITFENYDAQDCDATALQDVFADHLSGIEGAEIGEITILRMDGVTPYQVEEKKS